MINPVLGREIKERMRSRRAVIILVGFLAVLAAILYLVYRSGQYSILVSGFEFAGSSSASLGRLMFEWLTLLMLLFVSFIAPGIAAGSIVVERERRTLDTLQVTMLSPRSIVLGKLGASLSFVTLLVVASAPLFAIALVLGGVTPWQVLRALVVILTLELTLASVATYLSSRARRVQFATVAAYAASLMLLGGTGVLFTAEMLWKTSRGLHGVDDDSAAIYLNPVAALGDAVGDARNSNSMPNPLSGIASFTQRLGEQDRFDSSAGFEEGVIVAEPGFGGRRVVREVGNVPLEEARRVERPRGRIDLWIIHLTLLLLTSLLSVLAASRRLRAPATKPHRMRERKR